MEMLGCCGDLLLPALLCTLCGDTTGIIRPVRVWVGMAVVNIIESTQLPHKMQAEKINDMKKRIALSQYCIYKF